jgi:hypothetical protein
LTSVLAGDEWSASSPCLFTPGKELSVPIRYEVGWTLETYEEYGNVMEIFT